MDEDDDFIRIASLKDIQVTPDEEFQDLTMEDMRRFIFKALGLGHEFYKKYAKVQGFGVWKDGICKSRRDGIQLRHHSHVLSRVHT